MATKSWPYPLVTEQVPEYPQALGSLHFHPCLAQVWRTCKALAGGTQALASIETIQKSQSLVQLLLWTLSAVRGGRSARPHAGQEAPLHESLKHLCAQS